MRKNRIRQGVGHRKSKTMPSEVHDNESDNSDHDDLQDSLNEMTHNRSRTLPVEMPRQKLVRKLTSINLDRLRNAKEVAERAIKVGNSRGYRGSLRGKM